MALVVPNSIPTNFQTNMTAAAGAAARIGISVTASATTNTKGTFTEIINSTTKGTYGLYVFSRAISVSAQAHNVLMDLALGATSSEVVLIPNLITSSADIDGPGKAWYFPLYIPSGTRISARTQSGTVSKSSSVSVILFQGNNYPINAPSAVIDYGTNLSNSSGVTIANPGGPTSFGDWTSVVSGLTRDHRYWTLGLGPEGDISMNRVQDVVQIGVGITFGNVTSIAQFITSEGILETMYAPYPELLYAPVAAGTTIWARICSQQSDNRAIILYGI